MSKYQTEIEHAHKRLAGVGNLSDWELKLLYNHYGKILGLLSDLNTLEYKAFKDNITQKLLRVSDYITARRIANVPMSRCSKEIP